MIREKANFINKIAEEQKLSQDDTEVILFGYNLLVNSFLGLVSILAAAYILGIFKTVLVATITAAFFRAFTGGTHANSPTKCIVFGACIFNLLGLITVHLNNAISKTNYTGTLFIMVISIAAISFYLYAPADAPGKPITAKVHRKKLKTLAFISLLIWGIFIMVCFRGATMPQQLVLASCLGLIWQSVSLWPITYMLFSHK